MIQISLLGSLQVVINQVPLDALRGQRVRSIFTYLTLHADTAVSRSELAGTLWPDISETQARTNLRRELHSLKHTHQTIDACITTSKNTVTWSMPSDYSYDIEEFDRLCRSFEAEQDGVKKSNLGLQAAALYRDQLRPGNSEKWLSCKRDTLHRQWNLLSENLIELLQVSGDVERIIDIAARQLSFDPYLETAYLAMMEAYIAAGNSAMALHTYHQCASILKNDLDINPNEHIQTLYKQLTARGSVQGEGFADGSFSLKATPDLIGRSEALAELTEFTGVSFSGAPHIAFITGESGIGKSTLAEAVLNSHRSDHLIKVRSGCHPARVETAFGPFKDWINDRRFWKASKDAVEFDNETLQHIFPQIAAHLTATNSEKTANKKNRKLSSQEEIFTALSNIVCKVAEFYSTEQQAKLLLYIDDLQWADTDFFNWLRYFLSNQKSADVVFLVTVRTEEMDSVNSISGLINDFDLSHQIYLKQLSYLTKSEACELISNTLANYPKANVIQINPDKLYKLVQGNPLFLIESVNHLMEQSLSLVIDKQTDSGAAPKIYSMLKRRIDLLEEDSRHLLLLASVVQRQFSLPLIQSITQFSDIQLMDSLDNLWKRGMLREGSHGDYDFAHDSLREACYAALTSPGKRIMHAQIARALENLNAGQAESFAGEIAAHYEKSGNEQLAFEWFERALGYSINSLAVNSCIEYGERCLALIDTALPVANRAEKQVRVLLKLSYGYSLKEGFGSKSILPLAKEIEALLPFVSDSETRWRAVSRLRIMATFSYQTYRALRLTEVQLSTANDTGSITNIIEAQKGRAFVLYQLGRLPESLSYLDAGLKVAVTAESQGKIDRDRPPGSLAMLSKMRIQLLYLTGRFDDAISENQHHYSHEYCVGNAYTRSLVSLWEAKNNFIRNRGVDAEKIGQEMIKVGSEEKLFQIECLGKFYCDWAEWKKGNTQAAIASLNHTIEMHDSLDTNILLSLWYHTLAEMQYSAQQFDEALQSNRKAIQAVRLTRVFNRKADIYRGRANILAAKNTDPAEIIRLFDLSLKVSLKQSALFYVVKGLVDKIVFLQKHKLPAKADAQLLRQVIDRVQMSSDFESLAAAQSLLEEFSAE